MEAHERLEYVATVFDRVAQVVLIGIFLTVAAIWMSIFLEAEDWWAAGGLGLVVLVLMSGLAHYARLVAAVLLSSDGGVVLNTRSANVGETIEGHVRMGWGTIRPGTLRVQLLCREGAWRSSGGVKWRTLWMAEQRQEAEDTPEGYRVPFRFEIPGHLPGTAWKNGPPRPVSWGIELVSPFTLRTVESHEVQIFGPLSEAGRALKTAMRNRPAAFSAEEAL